MKIMGEPAQIPVVLASLCAIQGEMAKEGIEKGRNSSELKYKFRGIDDVLNALAPKLAAHNVVMVPAVEDRQFIERQTARGNAIFYTTLKVRYTFFSSIDGSSVEAVAIGEAMDTSDKSTGKAMSMAFKSLAFQLFCIPTEGDNDIENQNHEVVAVRKEPDDASIAHWRSELSPEQLAAIKGLCKARSIKLSEFLKEAYDLDVRTGEQLIAYADGVIPS